MNLKHRLLCFLPAVFSVAACAHYPVNTALSNFDPHAGYRFANFPPTAQNSDDIFVVLALSGGGARAAAFSYGVLEQLRRTPITRNGKTESLLDEVDVIAPASASGFTAAYYALHQEQTFDAFPKRFLANDLQAQVIGDAANPLNWFRLASPTFGRTDLAAEAYDRTLFDHHTFGDLIREHRRPYLLLSATDMTRGTRFEFTQEQFDGLNSDLASVPIARAVAASAAFPVALSPVTFNNYPRGRDYEEPAWIGQTIADDAAPAALQARARDLHSFADVAARPRVRLIDGAVADYTGLRGPMLAFTSTQGDFSIRRLIDAGKIKKLVIISVNAVRMPQSWDQQDSVPGWYDTLYLTASAPIRNNAYETIARFRELLKEDQAVNPARRVPYESRFVAIDFDSVKDSSLRNRLEQIRTTLSVTRQQAADLRLAAGEAVRDSAEFQALAKDLR